MDSSLYSACHNFVVFQFLYRSQMIDYFVGALMSQSIPTGYIPPPGNPRGIAKEIARGGQDLTFESCPGTGMAGILWKFKVERLVRILVSLVINTRCPKNCLKMGNTTLLISSSNYAKRHINVCSGGDLCSPFFSNFSETPCVKIGFDVRISFLWWMRAVLLKMGDPIFFCLPRLYNYLLRTGF